MMTRKERRAAEHAARKAAQKAPNTNNQPISPNPSEPITPSPAPAQEPEKISEARLNANRANAQHSTGPTSEAGKAKVSLNALKTGLTGRAVVLPFEDAAAYQSLIADYQKTFLPVGPVETGLVQSLADIAWRLERIPGLEYALLELGYNQLGHENPEVAKNTNHAILEMHIRQMHEKQFRNLHIQENRLVSRRNREMKELRALQETRKAKELEELNRAAQAALVSEKNQQPFNLAALGFEFSPQQFAFHMARLTPVMKQNLLKEALPTAA